VHVSRFDGLPCTEQGIRDAIASGGGPYTFDCAGPTTVVMQAEVVIDNDVILDGLGLLTVDGGGSHRVFSVSSGVIAELHGFVVTGGNPVTGGGGGIFNQGFLTLADSTVSGNSGGGILTFSPVEVTNSTVSGNTAYSGGGIWSSGGSVTLTNSTVSGNTADGEFGFGGGILSDYMSGLTITNSTVSGNSAVLAGGGIVAVEGGAVDISNSTISANIAGDSCGAILGSVRSLTVTSSTISGNAAGGTGSSVCWDGSGFWTYTLTNSLIDGECDVSSVISAGGNIESPGDTCGLTDPSDQVAVTSGQLNLGPLQDNGGPTLTYAPLPGSFAIDAIAVEDCVDADGMPLLTDQRGVSRPQGSACDVGAVEVEP